MGRRFRVLALMSASSHASPRREKKTFRTGLWSHPTGSSIVVSGC
jgi:hypothetical protein